MAGLSNIYNYESLVRTFRIVYNCSKGWFWARILLNILQAVLPLVPLYLLKLLLDAFSESTTPEFNYVLYILIAFAVVQIIQIWASNAMNYVSLVQADLVKDHMSKRIIDQSIKIDLQNFDSDVYHDTYERAVNEAGTRPISFINALSSFFQNMVSLIAVMGLLIALHWSVTIILVVIAIPVVLIRLHYTKSLVKLRVNQTQEERKSNYYKEILTQTAYAKEVRVFNFGEALANRFNDLRNILRDQKKKLYSKRSNSVSLAQSVESAAIVIALAVIVQRAIKGLISVGDIAMYLGVFQKGQSSINNALKATVTIHENRLYLEHLFDFLDLEPVIKSPSSPSALPASFENLKMEHVSFTYPETTNQIFNNFSIEFKKGKLTAIVGENGSGKSTLVKLIQRLYNVDDGKISVDGVNINSFLADDYRNRLSIVFQDFSKYQATASENIQLSDFSENYDLDQIKKAARLARADEFIERLENAYDNQLGREFKNGAELSGGQWQKIAIARAHFRDTEVLILDEPTSFIDPLSEEEIFNEFKQLAKDKIVILITHRVYNLKSADEIIVLDKGKIIEKGTHDELMNLSGTYKEMFDSQQ